jgi:hypothetical protein
LNLLLKKYKIDYSNLVLGLNECFDEIKNFNLSSENDIIDVFKQNKSIVYLLASDMSWLLEFRFKNIIRYGVSNQLRPTSPCTGP